MILGKWDQKYSIHDTEKAAARYIAEPRSFIMSHDT